MKKRIKTLLCIILTASSVILAYYHIAGLLFLFFTILSIGLSSFAFIFIQRTFHAKWSDKYERTALFFSNLVYYSIPVFIILWFYISSKDHSFDNDMLNIYYGNYFILARYILFYILWIYSFRKIHNKQKSEIKLTVILSTFSVIAYDVIILASILSESEVWFSAVYGIYYIISCFTGFLALLLIVSGYKYAIERSERINMAKMLFAVNILWAYVAFTQYLIISYGNLPKELLFYDLRLNNGWEILLIFIALLHFILPFLILLRKKAKENIAILYIASAMIFISYIIEMFWIIYPFFFQEIFFFL